MMDPFDGVPTDVQGRLTQVAQVCLAADRAWAEATGAGVPASWEDATEEDKRARIVGVMQVLGGVKPETVHAEVVALKFERGWTWGPVFDKEARTDPNLVPYEELPEGSRRRDALTQAVVVALLADNVEFLLGAMKDRMNRLFNAVLPLYEAAVDAGGPGAASDPVVEARTALGLELLQAVDMALLDRQVDERVEPGPMTFAAGALATDPATADSPARTELAICEMCEPRTPMPFEDAAAADGWADAHLFSTGHEVTRESQVDDGSGRSMYEQWKAANER